MAAMLVGGAVLGMAKQPKSFLPKQVLFVHGSPRDVVEYLYPATALSILRAIADKADADIIVHGHTHQPSRSFVPDLHFRPNKNSSKADERRSPPSPPGVTFVGVGSVGRSAQPGVAEYAVLQIINETVEVDFRAVEYDAEREAASAGSMVCRKRWHTSSEPDGCPSSRYPLPVNVRRRWTEPAFTAYIQVLD